MSIGFRFVVILGLLGLTVACSSAPKEKDPNYSKRIAVMNYSNKKPVADQGLSDFDRSLPEQKINSEWPMSGGSIEHKLFNPTLSSSPSKAWDITIGRGSSGYYRLLGLPIIADNKVFAIDAKGIVTALTLKDGDKLWKLDTTPPNADDSAIAGGLGYDKNSLYVTTGFGECLAINASTGSIQWRKMIGKPLRAAPMIANGQVYVVTIDNELHVLETTTGTEIWHHNGITENASLMGASSPAIIGDSVIVTYSSGEIFSLRAQNGRIAWNDVLTNTTQVGALPAISDIRGLPVIDNGLVFVVSHGERMSAVDLRSGERAWEIDVGGVNTPAISNPLVYVVTNNNELLAITKESGRILWVKELQKLKDSNDRDSKPVLWWGPVMAGDRLWMTNTLGHLVSFSPIDGSQLSDLEVSKSFYLPPVIANSTLFVLDNNAKLFALR